jgi:hypothetical protein
MSLESEGGRRMRYIGSLIALFGLSGFILPQIMRDPPFWDGLNNDAPMVAAVLTAIGVVLLALSFIKRKKKAG